MDTTRFGAEHSFIALRRFSSRAVLVPLIGAALAVASSAGAVLLQRRDVENRNAQLALADVKNRLSYLQGLPWEVENPRHGSAQRIHRRMAGLEAGIVASLAKLERSSPPRELGPVAPAVARNFATQEPIFRMGVAPSGWTDPVATGRVAGAQTRTLGTAMARLDAAGRGYAHRAAVGIWESRIGILATVFALLAGFLHYFRRSEKTRTRLVRQATRDGLTGLLNREAFLRGLAARLDEPSARPAAVLFVDLDAFKDVNDVFGHRGGDTVLRELAARLERSTRPVDLCARLGGDEFAVVLADADAATAEAFAARVTASLGEPVPIGGRVARIGASVGIAVAEPGVGEETLVNWADVAMYAAKAQGAGRIELFDRRLLGGERSRVTFERQLGAAAARGEVVVHYQPIVSLASRRCVAVEALARWRHPEHGLLPPVEFIQAAERTGAIVDIGRAVLEQACADAAAWHVATGLRLDLYVNVSGRQLADDEFVETVTGALASATLPPDRLVLELTEGALLHSPATHHRLAKLVSHGVGIAIDDFGTGYASLTTLRSLPIGTVKIDRSFVARALESPADEAVVDAIVQMAGRLGLHTIAEGVEREEQQALLEAIGARSVQGFLYSPPAPARDFLEWLAPSTRGPAGDRLPAARAGLALPAV